MVVGDDMAFLVPDEAGASTLGHFLRVQGIEGAHQPGIGDVHHRGAGTLEYLDVVGLIVGAESGIVLRLPEGQHGGRQQGKPNQQGLENFHRELTSLVSGLN